MTRNKRRNTVSSNPLLPFNVMEQFYYKGKPLPYNNWISEGISYNVQYKHGVGYDIATNRIVFPIKDKDGNIVGVKGRIIDDSSDKKYLYLYKCNNGIELFNFWNSVDEIIKEKIVYIFESEKSCLQAETFGIRNTVALGSSEISDTQVKRIKLLGLDIDPVLCYDKGLDKDIIKKSVDKFGNRRVYLMEDDSGYLKDKESPTDRGLEVWNSLVDNCISEVKKSKNKGETLL